MRWLTNEYDRLYKQVKEEKKVVCKVSFREIGGSNRDIAYIKNYLRKIIIEARDIVYGDTDQAAGLDEELRFIRMCEKKDIQWLDESEEPQGELCKQIIRIIRSGIIPTSELLTHLQSKYIIHKR